MTPEDAQLLSAVSSVVSAWASIAGVIGGLIGALVGAGASIAVSRRQFRADVLSRNRQEWINTLRDTVAEMLSLMSGIQADARHASWDRLESRRERINFLVWKLTLLVNPKEEDHDALLLDVTAAARAVDAVRHQGSTPSLQPFQSTIATTTQQILKREWERVKRGR